MLSDLLVACVQLKKYLENGNHRGKQFQDLIDAIYNEFKKFKTISIHDTKGFVDKHLTQLYKIHEIIVGTYAKLYFTNTEIAQLRNRYDSFFQKTLGLKRFPAKIQFLPTKITQEFCQGITLFQDNFEKDAHPFYHRSESCGARDKTASEKFSSDRVKNAVKLCYLERTIYDQVYINLLHYQDLGHLRELRIMEQYYDQYFPNESLIVKVKFNENDDSWPIELETTMINYATGKFTTETFRKPYDFIQGLYKKEVYCTRIKNTNKYEKVQSYLTNESSWILQK